MSEYAVWLDGTVCLIEEFDRISPGMPSEMPVAFVEAYCEADAEQQGLARLVL